MSASTNTNTKTEFAMVWLDDPNLSITDNLYMMTDADADKLQDFLLSDDYQWVIGEIKNEREEAEENDTKPVCRCYNNTYTFNQYCRCIDGANIESCQYTSMGKFSEEASIELKKSYNYISYETAMKETLELWDDVFDRMKERKEGRIIYQSLIKHRKITKDIHEEFEYARFNPRTTIGKLEFDRRLIEDGLDDCFAE